MQLSSFHHLPPLFLLLALLLAAVVFILQIGILGYAYEKIGISRRTAYLILLLSLAGAYVNIPIAELPGRQTVEYKFVGRRWGTSYYAPQIKEFPVTLALNVGGAIIPTVLSIYLMVKNQIYAPALIGTALVATVVHYLAEPIQGMGIAVPIFVPPIVSAVVAMLLAREHAAPLAYISGCLGTLLGADLMNLGLLAHLGASIASIGGAGTFDGVFLTGILAVLLAVSPRPAHAEPVEEPPPALP
ncbi:MAG: DUF1614 domain-containing protein [Pirellulales bacterium]